MYASQLMVPSMDFWTHFLCLLAGGVCKRDGGESHALCSAALFARLHSSVQADLGFGDVWHAVEGQLQCPPPNLLSPRKFLYLSSWLPTESKSDCPVLEDVCALRLSFSVTWQIPGCLQLACRA